MHFQHTACTSSENKGISEKYLGFCCIQRVPRANLGWETGVSIALRAEKNRMHLPIAVAYLGGHFLFVPVSPAVLRTLTEQWKAELTKRNASWGNKMVAVMGGGTEPSSRRLHEADFSPSERPLILSDSGHWNSLSEWKLQWGWAIFMIFKCLFYQP